MSDMELRERLWEIEQINRTEEARAGGVSTGKLANTGVDNKLVDMMVGPIATTISTIITTIEDKANTRKGGRGTRAWEMFLPLVEPTTTATVAVAALFSVMGSQPNPKQRKVINAIGDAFLRQVAFEQWISEDRKYASNYLKRMDRILAHKTPEARRKAKARLEKRVMETLHHEQEQLSDAALGLGAVLLEVVMDLYPDILIATYDGPKEDWRLRYSDEFLSDCSYLARLAAESRPMYRPMLVPPIDWHRNHDHNRYEGGYYGIHVPLYRPTLNHHHFKPSDQALVALNAIQATPWAVNHTALLFTQWLIEEGLAPTVPELPQRHFVDEFTWEALSRDERNTINQQNQDLMATWVAGASKGTSFLRKVSLAAELLNVNDGIFYQPHHFDFRGRIYPINTELTSQGDSWARGLIMFADGKPLGETGLDALRVHIANCAGKDKLSIDDRILWALTNRDTLIDAGMHFESMWDLIKDADEPLPMAAAVWEYTHALGLSDPTQFVSHLPIAVDGTCNGLQILSLLGKDPVGARSTNCTSDPERHDLYSEVSDAVREIMDKVFGSSDHSDEERKAASLWCEKMAADGRKVVKRAVMTTPYGVTDQGIVEQLVNDGMCNDLEPIDGDLSLRQNRHLLATYMARWIVEARAEVVREAMKIMQYFRDVTATLAENGHHLQWTTPDGCYVEQHYSVMKSRHICTLDSGRRRLSVPTDKVSTRKAQGACAPNVVHSLDACMLRQVVLALQAKDIYDFSMIHDSYAVHACYVDDMQYAIRQEGVNMFYMDWLFDEFHMDLVSAHPDLELPEPPEQGTLDVEAELPAAVYFFS